MLLGGFLNSYKLGVLYWIFYSNHYIVVYLSTRDSIADIAAELSCPYKFTIAGITVGDIDVFWVADI